MWRDLTPGTGAVGHVFVLINVAVTECTFPHLRAASAPLSSSYSFCYSTVVLPRSGYKEPALRVTIVGLRQSPRKTNIVVGKRVLF